MADIKMGDVVQLKSGGPSMTVSGTTPGVEQVECKWFDGKELKSAYIHPQALQAPPASSGSVSRRAPMA